MIDLYRILDLDYKVQRRKIFKRFVEYSRKYHPEFNRSAAARQKFIDINIAYYILEYEEFRREYDKLYKKCIVKTLNRLPNQSTIETKLTKWIKEGEQKANDYLKLSYKKFYRKIPKRETVFEMILDLIFHWIT